MPSAPYENRKWISVSQTNHTFDTVLCGTRNPSEKNFSFKWPKNDETKLDCALMWGKELFFLEIEIDTELTIDIDQAGPVAN